jgi:hypothetical protein
MVVNVPWVNTDTNTTYSAGSGLTLSGTTFSHSDTSTLAGTYGSAADNSKIDSITVDGFGHITAISSGSTGDIATVNGFESGNVTTYSEIVKSTASTNNVSYTATRGIMVGEATISQTHAANLRVAQGVTMPTGSSTARTISFGTTFAAAPTVIVFNMKATSTNTVAAAKATGVTSTGCTIIFTFRSSTINGYTPSTETHG